MKHFSKEWHKVELTHHVSKAATDAFWKLGKEWFHNLLETKSIQGVRRKTPDFVHLRRGLLNDYVPPVHLEIGYQHKQTGEITVIEDTLVTPRNRFPCHEYDKVWEIANVEVITTLNPIIGGKLMLR